MSDTPRTDEQELAYEAEDGSTYVHTTFARELEREIRQLEVAIYDLKTENNLLHEALDQVIEDRDSYHEENAELRRDKERLDWLLSKGLAWNGCYKGDWLEGEWMYGNSTFNPDARNDIDKAMEEEQ